MGNIVKEKSYKFSVQIVETYIYLSKEKKEYVLSKQLLRSGTSVGANIEEAIAGSSPKDFINKLTIANKEARETSYWLNLLKDTGFLKIDRFDDLQSRCLELRRLISSIIISTKRNTQNPSRPSIFNF
jgi:four helix bundle protein